MTVFIFSADQALKKLRDSKHWTALVASCPSHAHWLNGEPSERMKMSGRFVKGPWRYEQIDGASHWIPLEASNRLNQLLIEWLG